MAEIDKNWRPENWQQFKLRLADTPFVWSPAGPNVSHFEQIIEATASKILEELGKAELGGLRDVIPPEEPKGVDVGQTD